MDRNATVVALLVAVALVPLGAAAGAQAADGGVATDLDDAFYHEDHGDETETTDDGGFFASVPGLGVPAAAVAFGCAVLLARRR